MELIPHGATHCAKCGRKLYIFLKKDWKKVPARFYQGRVEYNHYHLICWEMVETEIARRKNG